MILCVMRAEKKRKEPRRLIYRSRDLSADGQTGRFRSALLRTKSDRDKSMSLG